MTKHLFRPTSARPHGLSLLEILIVVCFFVPGGYFIAKGLTGNPDATQAKSLAAASLTSLNSDADSQSLTYKPIEKVRVGDRVRGRNPQVTDDEREQERFAFADPVPDEWRHLFLRMKKDDGGQLNIQLLRPRTWLSDNAASVGKMVELHLEELGASGPAMVLQVLACPDLAPGAGPVVTGTFEHTSSAVLNVKLASLEEPIGTTAAHPFWSEDQQDFIPAGDLNIGERVRQFDESLTTVESITERGPPEAVYNIEVHGEHVYHVGRTGVLVHNAYDKINGQGLYVLRDPTTNVIKYVGRGDVPTRLAKHANTPGKAHLIPQVVYPVGSLTKAQAKGLEGRLMGRLGGPTSASNRSGLFNAYRSFSSTNKNNRLYRDAVTSDLWKETIKRLKKF